MLKIYVKAIIDEDVFDELCSYPERRVAIIEGSHMEAETLIAKEIWNIADKSPEYNDSSKRVIRVRE